MSDAILATGSTDSFSEGTCRNEYRVLADGTIETAPATYLDGRESVASGATGWTVGQWKWTPETGRVFVAGGWIALDQKAVLAMTKTSMSEGRIWERFAPEVKDAVRARYKFGPVATFACAAAKDGCVRTVTVRGAYCSHCVHDA